MKIIKAREKDHIEIKEARFYGELYQKLVAMPDRKRFKDGRFIFLNSSANIKYFLETFEECEVEPEAEQYFEEYKNTLSLQEDILESKEKEFEFKEYPEIFRTKPFNHQFKAFEISKDLHSYGLFFEQGCGKTKVIIDTASYLFKEDKIDCLVIIAPNGVHKNWITDELPTHCKVNYLEFCWEGKTNQKVQDKIELVKKYNELKVYSFNVECFVSQKQQDMLIDILKNNRCILVVDESQTIKNPSAKRTKFIVEKASKLALYRRILTGTPITKGTEDIYSQFKFLNPNIIGLSSYYAFRNKYCQMGGYLQRQIIGYKGIDELQHKIKTYTMRVLKKDCLDLPEKMYQKEPFSLTTEQLKAYNEVRDEGITYLSRCKETSEPITFDNVLVRMKKLQQISSGYLMNVEDGKFIEIVKPEHNPRLLKLKELLNNIEGKAIIWTIYSADIVYIMKILGDEAVRYDGKISTEDRQINRDKFKNDPKIKYFVANLQAAARGLTLTEATTAIYYNNSYDLELRLQSEDRCHRIGTKENVLYIDLEASKTIDKKIIRALRSKKKVADMVLQDPDSLFMEN